ncbi:MAG TPA: hypothetical protein VGR48_07305 [Terriglobales bacterium]|nr:hypothetical protein [Terriglobales bacterium]
MTQDSAVNIGRHAAGCKICAHSHREEIENDFIGWRRPAAIAKEYGLKDRSTVYRHAHALDLFQKRQRNVRAALERIIERAGEVEVNASAVVSAVSAYSRINASGQWVERSERVDLNHLFERMTSAELDAYVRDGQLPDWFNDVISGVARGGGSKEGNGSE